MSSQLFRAVFGLLMGVVVLGAFALSSTQVVLEAVAPTPVATPAVFPEVDRLDAFVCDVPDSDNPVPVCHAIMSADAHAAEPLAPQSAEPCVDGLAADLYPCENVDMLSFVPLADLGGSAANDIWGWTDGETGREYALIGLNNGVAFVDVTEPITPVVVGRLPTYARSSAWRDVKVYENHAYIVADLAGNHGLQIFDLTRLRGITTTTTFTESAHYDEFNESHNIIINEESGFAYAVGIQSGVTCRGGLHMINIQEPANPVFAGCFSDDGYTHDAQCVMYNGPDPAYGGHEICFNANTDSVAILDVTDKGEPVKLGTAEYSAAAYTHQLWVTADHEYMIVNDELDELSGLTKNGLSKTYVFNVRDLDEPKLIGSYTSTETSIDHNLYIRDSHVYQTNYQTGLRILDGTEIERGTLREVGYFDTYTSDNDLGFNGAWSNYPFFESGIVIVSSIEQGLFVLQPTIEGRFVTNVYLPAVFGGE